VTVEATLLHQMLEEVRAIRERLGETAQSQSSVQIATSTRGADIQVKSYVGSPVREAGDAAFMEYTRIRQLLSDEVMAAFAQEAAKRGKA